LTRPGYKTDAILSERGAEAVKGLGFGDGLPASGRDAKQIRSRVIFID
jgi:hypothetical protein